MIRMLFALALSAVVIAPAVADRRTTADPADAAVRREDIKKKIRTMRAYTLTEELALDEATAGKLFPVLAKWDDVTEKLLAQRVNLTSQLRRSATLAPKAVDKLIDEALANQRAFWDLEDKRLAELRKILTPAQTAQLLVVLPQFERRIQNQLRRAISKPGRARGRARRNEDIDDDLEGDEQPAGLPGPQDPRTGPAKRVVPPATPCDPFSSRYGCPSKR